MSTFKFWIFEIGIYSGIWCLISILALCAIVMSWVNIRRCRKIDTGYAHKNKMLLGEAVDSAAAGSILLIIIWGLVTAFYGSSILEDDQFTKTPSLIEEYKDIPYLISISQKKPVTLPEHSLVPIHRRGSLNSPHIQDTYLATRLYSAMQDEWYAITAEEYKGMLEQIKNLEHDLKMARSQTQVQLE